MPALNEKQAFALRLKQALKRAPKKVSTAAQLADQFNLQYQGEPVTQQATQKWLTGLAKPTLDKMEVLAEWLDVSLQWLRHGIPEERPTAKAGRKAAKGKAPAISPPTEEELKLLARIRNLPEHRHYLVTEIVEQFAIEGEMWRD